MWVAVADGADGNARDEVDIFLAVLVHEGASLTAARARASRSPRPPPEAHREVRGDGRGRLVAEEREARPRIEVDQHELARGGRDAVAAVDLEAERAGRLPHEARERPLVEGVAAKLLVLVVEPPEPGRLAVGAAAGTAA